MAIMMKCKMCGGDLALVPGSAIAACEYCGTTQTVPSADNDKKMNLFARAHALRYECEFDKASTIYETIVAEFPAEAEAYWGLVLCKYGVEYVDDPATGKKIPTCHRTSFDSVMENANFEKVLDLADAVSRKIYREEAKALEEIRKGIIEVSSKEDPYDIFICYKETDENGERTLDSVLAQDIYKTLTKEGYRVFFARISLEDKLGKEYEPYIFAALNSAKVMLAIGTDYEYFNAVWVKNEWSRYLRLIEAGQNKTLIPCFKGIDAYDMPKEFAKLQAQDLGKVGAMQDLLHGVEKLISAGEATAPGTGIQADDVNNLLVYNSALEAMKKKRISAQKEAVEKLKTITGWRDADALLIQAEAKLKKYKRKKINTILAILFALIISVGGLVLVTKFVQQKTQYEHAVYLSENYLYEYALDEFLALRDYRDAQEQAARMENVIEINMEAIALLKDRYYLNYIPYDNSVGYVMDNSLHIGNIGASPFGGASCSWTLNQFVGVQYGYETYENRTVVSEAGHPVVRYDADTEKYIFVVTPADYYNENGIAHIRFTAVLDGDILIVDGLENYAGEPVTSLCCYD